MKTISCPYCSAEIEISSSCPNCNNTIQFIKENEERASKLFENAVRSLHTNNSKDALTYITDAIIYNPFELKYLKLAYIIYTKYGRFHEAKAVIIHVKENFSDQIEYFISMTDELVSENFIEYDQEISDGYKWHVSETVSKDLQQLPDIKSKKPYLIAAIIIILLFMISTVYLINRITIISNDNQNISSMSNKLVDSINVINKQLEEIIDYQIIAEILISKTLNEEKLGLLHNVNEKKLNQIIGINHREFSRLFYGEALKYYKFREYKKAYQLYLLSFKVSKNEYYSDDALYYAGLCLYIESLNDYKKILNDFIYRYPNSVYWDDAILLMAKESSISKSNIHHIKNNLDYLESSAFKNRIKTMVLK